MSGAHRLEELLPLMEAAFCAGGSFRFIPMGKSMEPTIHGGRDEVILVPPHDLKKGDAVLYRRKDGGFILHRIIRIHDNTLDTRGDGQLGVETGISADQVLAKLNGIVRNGRAIPVSSAAYRGRLFFTLIWQRLRLIAHTCGRPLKSLIGRKNK